MAASAGFIANIFCRCWRRVESNERGWLLLLVADGKSRTSRVNDDPDNTYRYQARQNKEDKTPSGDSLSFVPSNRKHGSKPDNEELSAKEPETIRQYLAQVRESQRMATSAGYWQNQKSLIFLFDRHMPER